MQNVISFMQKKILWGSIALIIVGLSIFVIATSIGKSKSDKSDKLRVVTTLFPLYSFAKEIGGDKVDVSLLLPPGVESHVYEPKPSDIVKINESDVFVYTGKYMERWAEDIIKGLSNEHLIIIDSSNGIKLAKGEDGEDVHGEKSGDGFDPHIWLDFNNAQIMVDGIMKAMIEQDPSNAVYYTNNANQYKKQLTVVDDNYRTTLLKCQSKEIVYGGHYAFGYMVRRYGLSYVAAQGFAPDSEPTANDLVALVKQIKKRGIQYIFYEELSSPKIAQTLSNETSAKMLLLNGAHNISKDDLASEVGFIGLMERNLDNLSLGLGCLK